MGGGAHARHDTTDSLMSEKFSAYFSACHKELMKISIEWETTTSRDDETASTAKCYDFIITGKDSHLTCCVLCFSPTITKSRSCVGLNSSSLDCCCLAFTHSDRSSTAVRSLLIMRKRLKLPSNYAFMQIANWLRLDVAAYFLICHKLDSSP